MDPTADIATASTKNQNLRKRYNKFVVIDLEKRAVLRNLVKQNTLCQHKQIYTQANAICRRISSSYEEGRISAQQALQLMIEAHNQMSHRGLPKEVVADEMNKRITKLEKGENTIFEVTMANVSHANNLEGRQKNSDLNNEDPSNKYSESYWSEVI
ncbi:MAG TPA: hypothetical protein VE076_13790 [Nitrososphaeraceae archaeon]|jgi:hypothetical protein|nr:hypothetical protein [Nitrososphaeraceae archaeon]